VSDNNYLVNGRFLHDLNGWTPTSTAYNAGDGDEHYGIALIEDGGNIEQPFGVVHVRTYAVHVAVKPVSDLSGSDATVVIEDGSGNTVITQNLTGTGGSWTENEFSIGLAPGTTYTLRITNSSGNQLKIDDVWLWWVPTTRAAIASRVHAKLGRLATQRSLSTTPAGSLTEGDYTYAIDAGLRSIGAVDPETALPDVRFLDEGSVAIVDSYVEREMLERLQRDYAVDVDTRVGARQESLSQIAKRIGEITGTSGDSGSGAGEERPVIVRKLRRE